MSPTNFLPAVMRPKIDEKPQMRVELEQLQNLLVALRRLAVLEYNTTSMSKVLRMLIVERAWINPELAK